MRWSDLRRHLGFGQNHDLRDIKGLDWPTIRPALAEGLYGEDQPLPVPVEDLGDLVAARATDSVPTRLHWEGLSSEEFERVIFALISGAANYENPQWLTRTNAPDRGRDISAVHVTADELTDTRRERVIIQCRHWLTRSIGVAEFSTLKSQ